MSGTDTQDAEQMDESAGRAAEDANRVAEDTLRGSYGRLVAFLASITGDLATAEDALSDALVAALRVWPQRGVPARPESWLLTAARRNLVDTARRRAVARRHLPELARIVDAGAADLPSPIPDRRLELMFACTHPAIDVAMRSPLMLQTVLGLDATRIGSAFLVAPSTMGQRLVRVKKKIHDAGVPFRIPDPEVLPERLGSVLDAVYAAYGTGWDGGPVSDNGGTTGLVEEALRLGRLLAELLPDQAETHGLLALMLHSSARTAARRSTAGSFVPLEQQDVTVWDAAAIAEAEHHLARALALRRVGPFQLHAAIQSVHNRRALTGTTDWDAVCALYDGLIALAPTVGAYVARAAAVTRSRGPAAGLQMLDELPPDRVAAYQPYWVARAEALRGTGNAAAADHATDVAIGVTTDPAVRRFLLAGRCRGDS